MDWRVAAANTAWLLGNLPRSRRFCHALRRPHHAQQEILQRYLRQNSDTAFGRRHGFAQIRSPSEYQQRVPPSDYEAYRPYVTQIAAGEQHVLTHAPVLHFALSSGSAGAEKWIPYTKALLDEFGRAIAPWIASLFHSHPALRRGPAYWSITPVGPRPQTASRVPVGFDEDSAYLGGLFKKLVDATLAVPGELRHVADMQAFRYLTLLWLLRARELRLISVWHPSYLTLLLRAAEPFWERLLDDIRTGNCRPPAPIPASSAKALAACQPNPRRADELQRCGPTHVEQFWPNLDVISCWTDAHAAAPSQELAALFPSVTIQGKGLLSTEGVISIPLSTGGATRYPLAIRSHFFEFLSDAGDCVFADKVDVGGEYTVVISTAGGFYRYNTGDRVRVTASCANTPCIEFLGKGDQVSDRFGEKLSAMFVATVLRDLCRKFSLSPQFNMLAPDGPGYTLFLQTQQATPPSLAAALDELLSQNPHYAYCRLLGQLAPPRLFLIESAANETYIEVCRKHGQRLGNIKPAVLHRDPSWREAFRGAYNGDPLHSPEARLIPAATPNRRFLNPSSH